MKKKPLKIYIASPYSHKESKIKETNATIVIDSAIKIFQKGHFPYAPHLTHFVDIRAKEIGVNITWRGYMKWHDVWLTVCDAFLYLGSSRGADRELKKAKKLGIKIFYSIDKIPTIYKS
jgi:hypothetical protein